ncbi:MAG: Uncharacterised protein [Methanobacteriota archaeon]|nr:MAG: Uncharacterised protein [Euryarchaeota archaeon]
MDEFINSEPWWQSRINEIKSEGFNLDELIKKLKENSSQASVILEQAEKEFVLAQDLKKNISELPNRFEIERSKLLKKLKMLENVHDVQEELNLLLSTFFPWRNSAKRNKILWDSAGRGATLDKIVRRLDNLDASMNSQILNLLPLFETPENFNELLKKINNVEVRQSERIATLDSMASLLSEKGFEIQGFNEMSLGERFDAIEELQILDDAHMKLERRINRTIGRFDSDAAINYNQQRLLLTKTRSLSEFESLLERVKNSENDYLTRLENINNQFSLWIKDGFKLNVHVPILADELLEKEGAIANFSQNIQEYKQIWERLVHQYTIWPEEEAVTQIEYGVLSEKSDIEVIVIELEKRSELIAEEVQVMITKWKNKDFELKDIEDLNLINPRVAKSKMDESAIIFEELIEARFRLNSLDLSFIGESKREEWNNKLINLIPNSSLLNDLMEWVFVIEKRNQRHRKMLENEWEKYQNLSEGETSKLTLIEFENLIRKMDSDESIKLNKFNSKNSLKERLIIEIKLWIDNLKTIGWNVESLELMISQQPNKILEAKHEITKQIKNYDKLIKRLENLPWERNVDLAKKIIADLRRPELLKTIHDLVPQYMQTLATSSKQNDALDFDFNPWKPNTNIASSIKPKEIPEAEVIIGDSISSIDGGRVGTLEQIFVDAEKEVKPQDYSNIPSYNLETPHNQSNLEHYEEKKLEQEIKEIKPITYQPDAKEWETYTNSLKNILSKLGIKVNHELISKDLKSLSAIRKDLAKHVGITPRDSRVDRLLRILLRLIPISLPENIGLLSLSETIEKLTFCVKKLNEWTGKRLERRNNSSSGKLLTDSKNLGLELLKIPSPGFAIPLTSDNYDLPSINEFSDLNKAVHKLEKSILLL